MMFFYRVISACSVVGVVEGVNFRRVGVVVQGDHAQGQKSKGGDYSKNEASRVAYVVKKTFIEMAEDEQERHRDPRRTRSLPPSLERGRSCGGGLFNIKKLI